MSIEERNRKREELENKSEDKKKSNKEFKVRKVIEIRLKDKNCQSKYMISHQNH